MTTDRDGRATILVDLDPAGVLTITLNRPEALNSFNQQMCDEFEELWREVREDDAVRSVVLRAAGDRAFCTGVDVKEGLRAYDNVWSRPSVWSQLSPKANAVWKPVVCAVHGMAAGGALYWLNDCDVLIASDDATFFDPHVDGGLVAADEPIGMILRAPLGEVLRMALMGLDERVSAKRAYELGWVSEVVGREELWARADDIAQRLAAKPPTAIQGTVRAIWESLDAPRTTALVRGASYPRLAAGAGSARRELEERPVERRTPRIR